ncbi:hypothetical protein BBF96_01155 [Anoxybacter fermentans]|uniref:Uncharacterized protein n=2 Tax=Anoxybacter fermentans TaxID=1323375 RepID=A0A3Q9HUQ3_9FIRM|nr:hypothetical protein BBF96_01155 [Anoxybacter fermentans]
MEVLNIPSGGLYDKFFTHREALIAQFSMGDISKREFIAANYDFVMSLGVKPFKNIDCLQKGFFNYHYYNILAKYRYMEARDIKRKGEYEKYYRKAIEEVNYYYRQKDLATLKILELIDFKNVEAYYIRVRSKFLKGELIEIILHDFEDLILHTKNERIREKLEQAGAFRYDNRKSVIDQYINQKY